MPAPVSVIIPTLNSTAHISPTLRSVFDGVEQGLIREVIFADGGSTDQISDLAKETGAVLVTGKTGRGSQLAAGARVAKSDWLLFLHSDSTLSPKWESEMAACLAQPNIARYARLAFDATGLASKYVAAWANLRSRIFGLPYGDQGLLISRSLYGEVGGFADIPLMEDVTIARALRGRLKPMNITITTNAEKYQTQGWFTRGAINLGILARYFWGQDPEELARRYRR